MRVVPKKGASAKPGMAVHVAQVAQLALLVGLKINVQREPENIYWSALDEKGFLHVQLIRRATPDPCRRRMQMKLSKWNESHGIANEPQPARVFCDIQ